MKKKTTGIIIARCQPPHHAHIHLFTKALELTDEIIIVLGSHRSAPNIRNPWSFEERKAMIQDCFSVEENKRISFVAVRDHYYNDLHWLAELHEKIRSITENKTTPILFGHKKDETSYYLDYFPQWKFVDVGLTDEGLNATLIRNSLFVNNESSDIILKNTCPEPVYDFLNKFKTEQVEKFNELCASYEYIRDYKERWSRAPYPPTFVTVDTVVIKSGHVLLVRRGHHPGKGLWALPGGFLNQDETIKSAALRELKEETKIKINKKELESYIKSSHVFDAVRRSLRGRTISNAFFIKLPDGGDLPEVKGSDDAEAALWIPLGDLGLMEDKFFEDHLQIINFFTNQ